MKEIAIAVVMSLVAASGVSKAGADQKTVGTALLTPERAARLADVDQRRSSDLAEAVHREVNQFRREQNLEPLDLNPVISARAREHSEAMAAEGKLTHEGFPDRMAEIREKLEVQAAAENVGMIGGHEDPVRAVVEGWKNSFEHRKNMLGDFELTGIGVVRTEAGLYFFTQIFVRK